MLETHLLSSDFQILDNNMSQSIEQNRADLTNIENIGFSLSSFANRFSTFLRYEIGTINSDIFEP